MMLHLKIKFFSEKIIDSPHPVVLFTGNLIDSLINVINILHDVISFPKKVINSLIHVISMPGKVNDIPGKCYSL